jgi:hypothetical protein
MILYFFKSEIKLSLTHWHITNIQQIKMQDRKKKRKKKRVTSIKMSLYYF